MVMVLWWMKGGVKKNMGKLWMRECFCRYGVVVTLKEEDQVAARFAWGLAHYCRLVWMEVITYFEGERSKYFREKDGEGGRERDSMVYCLGCWCEVEKWGREGWMEKMKAVRERGGVTMEGEVWMKEFKINAGDSCMADEQRNPYTNQDPPTSSILFFTFS